MNHAVAVVAVIIMIIVYVAVHNEIQGSQTLAVLRNQISIRPIDLFVLHAAWSQKVDSSRPI